MNKIIFRFINILIIRVGLTLLYLYLFGVFFMFLVIMMPYIWLGTWTTFVLSLARGSHDILYWHFGIDAFQANLAFNYIQPVSWFFTIISCSLTTLYLMKMWQDLFAVIWKDNQKSFAPVLRLLRKYYHRPRYQYINIPNGTVLRVL